MDAPLWGDTGGHTGTAPAKLHHIFPRIPHKQNNHLHTIHPNGINRFMRNLPKRNRRGEHPRAILPNDITVPRTIHPKRNRRGGACVPARTSAQRRFHTKNTRIVRGDFNDGCALVGRHGRAHRHRPYPSPLYIHAQSTLNDTNRPRAIHPNETRKTIHTHIGGRKCIAHSRPHSLKQVVYANWHRDDAHLF